MSWPMPVDQQQLGAGDGGGGGAAARDVHHLVGEAVHDERRHAYAAQPGRPVRLGEDGEHLPHHAGGADATVEGLLGALPDLLLRLRVVGRPDQPPELGAGADVRLPAGPAAGEQRRHQARVLPADGALAGRRHDAGQRADPARVRDRHRLRDHPAHRHPDDVRRVEAEVVEQPERVVCQVRHRVRHPDLRAGERADQRRPGDPALEDGRASGVAVVVADHVEAGAGERLAQLRVPPVHRPAEAHHQQQRVVLGVTERLVAQLDAPSDRREQLLGDRHLGARGHAASQPVEPERDATPPISHRRGRVRP